MRVIGAILIALGLLGVANASDPPPGSDPAFAAGYTLGPFVLLGLGGFLSWLASKRDS